MSASYWRMRGFEPIVALACELYRVCPVDVGPGAPRTAVAVLGGLDPLLGPASPAVRRFVANGSHRLLAPPPVPAVTPAPAPTAVAGVSSPSLLGPQETAPRLTAVPGTTLDTAQAVEAADVRRELDRLLGLVHPAYLAAACGFSAGEWPRVPESRRASLALAHLGSFSAGSLRGCRLALTRLVAWLEVNHFPEAAACITAPPSGDSVSGGLLSWWVQDERDASVSSRGGASVPSSLRAGCVFAVRNLRLPLDVDAVGFAHVAALPARAPVPALSATVGMLFHFSRLSSSHASPIIRIYCFGFVLCLLAALRLRDAQRASVSFRSGYISGACFSSKHPKRRSALVMPFFAPLPEGRLAGALGDWAAPGRSSPSLLGPDFLFPRLRVPRGVCPSDPRVTTLPGPARSADVIRAMRHVLTLPPLSMSPDRARLYSGHSLRHLLPTLARLLGLPKEERDELARWAPTPEARGQRRAMSNMYAQEAECSRVLDICRRVLARMLVCTRAHVDVMPAEGGWDAFTPAAPQHVDAGVEASDSGSDSDSDETVLM